MTLAVHKVYVCSGDYSLSELVSERLIKLMNSKMKSYWPRPVKELKFRTKYFCVAIEMLGREEC